MRLTTKGRFAVTAMLDLALHTSNETPVALAGISERQGISLAYLEQLFGKLRRAHLVESIRGPGGGYYLARAPQEISVAEIILAVDDGLDATQCGGNKNCHHQQRACLTHSLWTGLNKTLLNHLSSISLKHLVSEHQDSFREALTSDERVFE